MAEPSSSDTNREPSNNKNCCLKVILKAVLKLATALYSLYRVISRLIDFFKEFLD
jgi:hypothetical protein